MIDFNRPAFTGREFDYIRDAVQRGMLCGDGEYTKRCSQWMMEHFNIKHVMLTTSCTHALEMAAHLCDIKPGSRRAAGARHAHRRSRLREHERAAQRV